jgi:hypothetical protein
VSYSFNNISNLRIIEDTADEPEVELGPGVKRIRDNTDIDDMLDDTIFLVFSSQLMTLANTCMQKTCKVKGCKEEAILIYLSDSYL